MSRNTPRYTDWMQAWHIDAGEDVRLDPDTGKLYEGKVILVADDLIEMLEQMGYVIASQRNVAGGTT